MGRHDDFDVLPKGDEKTKQPLNRELPEIAAQHFRNVRLLDAKQLCRVDLLQTTRLHEAANLVDELGLDEVFLGIRQSDIGKNVAASDLIGDLLHGSSPCAILSASRRRCSISFIST